ncbi:putative bifunctional diguanylate cyclase/phosphodiesterase [Enterovirga rhinocerotis]|uniref:Diguanylate cyclase/phosphodiesterase with PAS/PAC sensor(S) n=1 Tax=Enterovirga rhinocerotis TaxID=1339210 RepID=A0A4R7BJZ8_9HYPH|nr:EAL domain-containing protein [Enterovirga rhinocerotis]TDR85531.1 diguanylate cyclase/phosphodiesterase with PAS/PAC sensor(s) [Enterovirga rhinocerotis]
MSKSYPLPHDEQDRLNALEEYRLVDTRPDEEFDRLARLASSLFDVPIVLVSLIERSRQFFKSHIGLDLCETSREISFCAHAIMQDDVLVIPDAAKDPRFAANPLVLGPPFIRFYAGKPLVAPGGGKIGTVCLIDSKPRSTFSEEDRRNLGDVAALVMDRMEMRRLDHVRSTSQVRFENIAATSPDAIICSNAEGDVTFWNRSAERLFGYSAEEMLENSGEIIVPESWRQIYESELERLRQGEKMELADRTVELSGLRKDGSEFPAEFSLSTWKEGNTWSVGAIVRDVTERRHNEERLYRLASLDALTDLPNRGAWRECLKEALGAAKPLTVFSLDLDGFKDINDTLGHSAGDTVLKEVALRLKAACHDAIKVARLGGDEFVVLFDGNDARRAEAMAEMLIASISAPYEFSGKRIDVGVSIGIALAPQHSRNPEELLGAADLALYRSKAAGKGSFEIFAPALREVAVARRAFEKELKHAFENGEFELFYQPQIATADRRLTGAEALLRWNHPARGLLTPASFIDVLERKPSAAEVGDWILQAACRQAAEWRALAPDFRIAVNLFEAQFRSEHLPLAVAKALSLSGLPARALELEIVENIFLRNDRATERLFRDLRDLGVGLALDDYGTGFASLSLLKRYPFSRLKIDRTFVRDVHVNSEDAAIVKAILYLGDSFGMDVIAEGVETEAQLDFLKTNGCPEAQGYLFGRPMPAHAFRRFLQTKARPCTPARQLAGGAGS